MLNPACYRLPLIPLTMQGFVMASSKDFHVADIGLAGWGRRDGNAAGKEIWVTEFGYDACTPEAMRTQDFSKESIISAALTP